MNTHIQIKIKNNNKISKLKHKIKKKQKNKIQKNKIQKNEINAKKSFSMYILRKNVGTLFGSPLAKFDFDLRNEAVFEFLVCVWSFKTSF